MSTNNVDAAFSTALVETTSQYSESSSVQSYLDSGRRDSTATSVAGDAEVPNSGIVSPGSAERLLQKQYRNFDVFKELHPHRRPENAIKRFLLYRVCSMRTIFLSLFTITTALLSLAVTAILILSQVLILGDSIALLNHSISDYIDNIIAVNVFQRPLRLATLGAQQIMARDRYPLDVDEVRTYMYPVANSRTLDSVVAMRVVYFKDGMTGSFGFQVDDGFSYFQRRPNQTMYEFFDVADNVTGALQPTPFYAGPLVGLSSDRAEINIPRDEVFYTEGSLHIKADIAVQYFSLSTPFYDRNNTMQGYSMLEFSSESLARLLQDKSQIDTLRERGIAFVFTQDNRLVASSDPTIPITALSNSGMELMKAVDSTDIRIREAARYLAQNQVIEEQSFQILLSGNRFFACYHKIQIANTGKYWQLLVLNSLSDFNPTIATTIPISIVISLVFMAISLVGGYVFTFLISKRLRDVGVLMTAAADLRVEGIKFSENALSYVSEIRKIQLALFWMAHNLKKYKAFLPASVLEQIYAERRFSTGGAEVALEDASAADIEVGRTASIVDQGIDSTVPPIIIESPIQETPVATRSNHDPPKYFVPNRVVPLPQHPQAQPTPESVQDPHRLQIPSVSDAQQWAVTNGTNRFDLGLRTADISILSIRISNLCEITERLAPEKIVDMYRLIVKIMCQESGGGGGSFQQLTPSWFIISFNSVIPAPQVHARRASKVAIRIQRNIMDACRKYEHRGVVAPCVVFALSTGTSLIGNLGSDKARQFTILGQTMNTIEELDKFGEAMAFFGQILTDRSISRICRRKFQIRPKAFFDAAARTVEGHVLHNAVQQLEIFELVGEKKRSVGVRSSADPSNTGSDEAMEASLQDLFLRLKQESPQSQRNLIDEFIIKYPQVCAGLRCWCSGVTLTFTIPQCDDAKVLAHFVHSRGSLVIKLNNESISTPMRTLQEKIQGIRVGVAATNG